MTETPGSYDAANGGSRPQKRQRLPVTRTIQAKLLIEARAPVDIDEVIDTFGPGIKVLGMSTNYRQHSGDGVMRHVNIETVPDDQLQTEHRARSEKYVEIISSFTYPLGDGIELDVTIHHYENPPMALLHVGKGLSGASWIIPLDFALQLQLAFLVNSWTDKETNGQLD